MKTVRVAEELKRMDGGFLDREIAVPRDVESRPNRYGHTTWTEKMVLVRVIDFHGVTIEYSFLLKLLGMFKRTRVHTVEGREVPGRPTHHLRARDLPLERNRGWMTNA